MSIGYRNRTFYLFKLSFIDCPEGHKEDAPEGFRDWPECPQRFIRRPSKFVYKTWPESPAEIGQKLHQRRARMS